MKVIKPKYNCLLEQEGKLSYNYNSRSWTTLRLKKEFLRIFPIFERKRLCYRLSFFETKKEIIKHLDKCEDLPGLIYFFTCNEEPVKKVKKKKVKDPMVLLKSLLEEANDCNQK